MFTLYPRSGGFATFSAVNQDTTTGIPWTSKLCRSLPRTLLFYYFLLFIDIQPAVLVVFFSFPLSPLFRLTPAMLGVKIPW